MTAINLSTNSDQAWGSEIVRQKLKFLRFPIIIVCLYNMYYNAVRISATREKLPAPTNILNQRYRLHNIFFIGNMVINGLIATYSFIENHDLLLSMLLVWLVGYIGQYILFTYFAEGSFLIVTPRLLLDHKLNKPPKEARCWEKFPPNFEL